jgi:predicted dehydrogenase
VRLNSRYAESEDMSTTTPVRVGLVGLGNIGQHHADKLTRFDDATLVGGMDVDPEARSAFAAAYDCREYEDATRLLEDVDALVVTTPNRFHESYVLAALDADVPVLCEKPLAHTLESAERIAAAARDSDAFCMVGFNNRFAYPVEVLYDYVREGRLGDVRHVEANYVRRRGIPGRGSWFTSKAVAGGGALVDIGVHAVDLTMHFLNFPEVVEVSGASRSEFGGRDDYAWIRMWGDDTGPEDFDVEDSVTAFLRCADGTTVSLEVAWAANRVDDETYHLRGTDGGARFDRSAGELTLLEADRGGSDHLADTSIETRPSDPHRAEQRAFLDAVRTGEPPRRNTVEQGLAVQRVLDAIYRSAAAESAVTLEESTDVATEA